MIFEPGLSRLNELLFALPELKCFLNKYLTGVSRALDDLSGSFSRGKTKEVSRGNRAAQVHGHLDG